MVLKLRLLDFKVNEKPTSLYSINMYGIDKNRDTYSIKVKNFKPFVYILVSDRWTKQKTDEFIEHLKEHDDISIALQARENIVNYKLVKKKKLYGFDSGKYYNFIYIETKNMMFIHKIKTLYYDKETQKLNSGYMFGSTNTKLYESFIPPILRFFHIQELSPSGWVVIERYSVIKKKKTNCKYEVLCDYTNINPLNDVDDIVPYKICSFDIEANSSHGDFPEAVKDYKKVAYDIVYYLKNNEINKEDYKYTLSNLLKNVYSFENNTIIDKCYTKKDYKYNDFTIDLTKFYTKKITTTIQVENKLKKYFNDEDNNIKIKKIKQPDVISMLSNEDIDNPSKISHLMDLLDNVFPELQGDQVTFIGSTFVNYGEEKPYLNHCVCLNNTNRILDEHKIESYNTEKELLLAWKEVIKKEDPDIIIGYNIFGFDYPFMYERANQLDCVDEFMDLGRNNEYSTELYETSIVLASGPYNLKMIEMTGRLQIDLLVHMRKEYNLSSYKLDSVSGYLISDYVVSYENKENECFIITKNIKGLELHSFVCFEIQNHSTELYLDGKKFKLIKFTNDGFIVEGNIEINDKFTWCLAKDDVTPKDIFEMTKKGPDERGLIAKYCIQDCNLVQQIFQKVDVLTTFIEMSKLCSVPINYLVMRGQGIKLTSYIAKKCREKDTLMPLISKGYESDAFEGAIVLEPKCGLYLDNPVACVDYGSLYPSSIISENISHDSKVWTKEYDLNNELKTYPNGNPIIKGELNSDGTFKYDNLTNYKYVDIKYDTFKYIKTGGSAFKKVLTGYKICRYAQFPDNQKAVMPSILQELLEARKKTKQDMKNEKDPFKQNILDKRQLSIKITANSLYGQTGAKTSSFYEMDVAASTTATGRKLLIYAKELIENVYGDTEVDCKYGRVKTNAEYIYGDTDSVFFTFNLKEIDGTPINNKKALEITIDLAKEAGELATKFLKEPHDLEYEKTFMPFCLLSKKRYVGMLYEDDPNKCKRKSMGIVLKRRDNAPIVKDIYGGIIDILMKDKDIHKSIEFLNKMLNNLMDEKVNIDKLIITKSLRSFYKNPDQIAHAVLSKRIGERNPGSKPSPGDRIPYVYIINKKSKLQGERIETPEFINQENKKIDYGFYITNQIMKPIIQIYSLVLYDMKDFRRRKPSFILELETIKNNIDYDKYIKKEQVMKDKEVEKILFEKYIRIGKNLKNNNQMITSFFK